MIFILLLLVAPSITLPRQCSHKIRNPTMTNLSKNPGIRWKIELPPNYLRIHIHYEDSFNKLANKDFIKNVIINPAVKFWEKTLKVKHPMSQPIVLDRLCHGNIFDRLVVDEQEIKICRKSCIIDSNDGDIYTKCYMYDKNQSLITTGVAGEGVTNADLVILVDSGKECTNTTLASALEERIESEYNRPIIGSLSICPDTIDINSNIEETIQTVKHEIMHILGFSVSLFAYFRDEQGEPRTARDEKGLPNLGTLEAKDVWAYRPSNKTMMIFNETEMTPVGKRVREKAMLTTPNIVREARAYYNCSTLKGVFLEDFGEKGNAWSHFEMRTAYNELMSSVSGEEIYLSRLSLALLEDTGWYYVDYSQAENFTYGKGLGCDFVNKNCFEYIHSQLLKNQSSSPWCANVDETICSVDRTHEYTCSYQYGENKLPAQYKYYKDKKIYNIDPYVDHCPMYMTHFKASEYNRQCSSSYNYIKGHLVNSPYNITQSYGPRSKCVMAQYNSQLLVNSCESDSMKYINGGGCYKYRCSRMFGLLINIGDKEYQCFNEGEIINFTTSDYKYSVTGSLQCPKCTDICDSSQCVGTVKLIADRVSNRQNISDKVMLLNHDCSGGSYMATLFSITFPVFSFLVINQIEFPD